LGTLKFEGVFPALITPFKGVNEDLDEEAFRNLIDFVIERGVHGVVPCGTTGEFVYMSVEERMRAIEIAVDEVNDRGLVIAGAGASSTKETIKLVKHAENVGADAALVVLPYYLRPADKGAQQHFIEVAESTELPILLYNIPQCTGGFLDRRVIEDLAEIPNIVGLKDSSGYLPYTLELLQTVGDKLSIFCGHDEVVMPALVAGASGVILASANIIPEFWIELYNAIKRGEYEKARSIQMRVQKLARIIARYGGPLAVKAALKMLGLKVGRTRRPLVSGGSLSWEIREEIKLELEKLGLLKPEISEIKSSEIISSFEDLGLSEKEILEHNLRAGFASHGNGVEMVQIAILIGPKNSPAGYVWAKTFACLKSGKEALLAVLEPNLTVKPPTLIVPTVKIKSLRQASIIYGPVQAAVGKAIQDMVEEELITQNMIEDYVLIVKVHAFPEAVNRQLIYANTYHAVVKALKSAFGEG